MILIPMDSAGRIASIIISDYGLETDKGMKIFRQLEKIEKNLCERGYKTVKDRRCGQFTNEEFNFLKFNYEQGGKNAT